MSIDVRNAPAELPVRQTGATCRLCSAALQDTVVDLGMSPLCETFLLPDQLNRMEPFYPLHVFVCRECFLVQVEEYVTPEGIFAEDYPYFSSYSTSWLAHAERYVEAATERLGLGPANQVVELGSNDGYLLQYFQARGVRVLGIEPARNVAAVANAAGVPTRPVFFGVDTADELVAEGIRADLVCGANVLAQVPDLNDFVGGIKLLLAPGGTVTIEFPHLQRLLESNQYDTIYHEHFSYFSFATSVAALARHGMTVFDVEELPTHGGSLRIWARHAEDASRPVTRRAKDLLQREDEAGMQSLEHYASFARRVERSRRRLLSFLIEAKDAGRTVVGYGAPGKGNTLLNYCGVRPDLLAYTVDRNPLKHGRYTPGTRIPIHPPEHIDETKPDYVLILPWNLADEIVDQMSHIRQWGGRFVVPIPELAVLS